MVEELKLRYSLTDFEIYIIANHLAHFKINKGLDAKKDWIPECDGKGNRR